MWKKNENRKCSAFGRYAQKVFNAQLLFARVKIVHSFIQKLHDPLNTQMIVYTSVSCPCTIRDCIAKESNSLILSQYIERPLMPYKMIPGSVKIPKILDIAHACWNAYDGLCCPLGMMLPLNAFIFSKNHK